MLNLCYLAHTDKELQDFVEAKFCWLQCMSVLVATDIFGRGKIYAVDQLMVLRLEMSHNKCL